MHEVAQQDQTQRLVVAQQFDETLLDTLHSPERKQVAGSALTQLVTVMQVGHSEPALTLMKNRETAVEKNISCYRNLARRGVWHGEDRQSPGKLLLAIPGRNGIRAAVLQNVQIHKGYNCSGVCWFSSQLRRAASSACHSSVSERASHAKSSDDCLHTYGERRSP